MTITKKIGFIALLASLSWGAQAANFNYNYGQIGFETGDFEGLALTGLFKVNKETFVIARYVGLTETTTVLGVEVDVDYTEISVGAGYHMPINSKTDAVFTISFGSGEVDVASGTVDDTGLMLTAGVRHNLKNTKFELAGGVYYNTVLDGDSGIQGEARYNINRKMSAGINLTTGDYADGLGINFRMGF